MRIEKGKSQHRAEQLFIFLQTSMVPWQSIVLFLILFGWVASQCNYAACRTYCNSSRACFGHPCPDVMTIGQHVTVFFNWSTAEIGWTAGVSPDQLFVQTVLDLENYRRMLNNQTYIRLSECAPGVQLSDRQGRCFAGPRLGPGIHLYDSCL
jgi:hypothetical protein